MKSSVRRQQRLTQTQPNKCNPITHDSIRLNDPVWGLNQTSGVVAPGSPQMSSISIMMKDDFGCNCVLVLIRWHL